MKGTDYVGDNDIDDLIGYLVLLKIAKEKMMQIKMNHLVLNKFNKNLDGWGHLFKDQSFVNLTLNSKTLDVKNL